MGCGQSKIHLYPRKSKSKANGKKGGHGDSDAETDEDEGHIEDSDKNQNRDSEKNDETDEPSNKDTPETDEEVSVSLLRAKNLSLLQSQEISSSQQNFFRMLDRKIDEGPDYDSASETEIALEEARLNALVQHWESASLTASICSSASRSLQTTPVRQQAATGAVLVKQLPPPRGVLQATTTMPQGAVMNADFLSSSAGVAAAQLVATGSLQQQQQLVITHMNTKMLQHHQMVVVPQIPLGIPPELSAANTSNALSLMQATSASSSVASPPQAQQYLQLNLPAGSSPQQLLGKPNVSPKRMGDTRLMMNASPLAQQQQQMQQLPPQQQQQMLQSQFMATPPPGVGFVNGGRSPQPIQMPAGMQMVYFGQPTASQQNLQASLQHEQQLLQHQQQQQPPPQGQQPYYGVQAPPTEYRFPPAISVQRLAPQVQRQLRETQELIKDSCPQLYAAGYGSPGPPIRSQTRNPTRRPTPLETQFSQELS